MIEQIMYQGNRINTQPTLVESRTHATNEMASLPEDYRRLKSSTNYSVIISPALEDLADEVDQSTV